LDFTPPERAAISSNIDILHNCRVSVRAASDVATVSVMPTTRSSTFASLTLVIGALAAPLAGCTADAAAPNEPPTDTLGSQSAALSAFDPCDPGWQLPTWARHYLVNDDPTFRAFEDVLERDGARWIGSFSFEKPYRAIVRVDTFREFTKVDPRSALWYLAAVPVEAKDARRAITDFADLPPVSSRLLGVCTADKKFVRYNGAALPPNIAVKQLIVEYDPRCTCRETAHVQLQTWVVDHTYESTPTYTR